MKFENLIETSKSPVIDMEDGTVKAKRKVGDGVMWKRYQSFLCPVCNELSFSQYEYYIHSTLKGKTITCSQQCRGAIQFAVVNNIPIDEYLGEE